MMSINTARLGLAHIMRETGTEFWDHMVYDVSGEHVEGFRISRKIAGRRKLRNYFVPKQRVDAAEESLQVGIPPMRLGSEDLTRLPDSDM
jgi:hypothetical protein